jgi:hypothetical protein
MFPEEIRNLLKETTIVVDNARKPIHSVTDTAVRYPGLSRYPKPSFREKRMRRSREERPSSRWESIPCKCLSSCQRRSTELANSSYKELAFINFAAAMPLRMPVRSSDEQEWDTYATQLNDHARLIDCLDEALAISDCCLSDEL